MEIGEPTWLERKNMPSPGRVREGETVANYLMEFQLRTRLERPKGK